MKKFKVNNFIFIRKNFKQRIILCNFNYAKNFSDKQDISDKLPENITKSQSHNLTSQNKIDRDYFSVSNFLENEKTNTQNLINNEISQKIFDSIFTLEESKNKHNTDNKNFELNSNLINLNQNNLVNSNTIFTSTLDRSLDVDNNKEFSQLILDNKLNFQNEKINVKSLNISNSELNDSNDDK